MLTGVPFSLIMSPKYFSEAEFSSSCSPISIVYDSASSRDSILDFSVSMMTNFYVGGTELLSNKKDLSS